MKCNGILYLFLFILLSCKKEENGRTYVFTKDPFISDSLNQLTHRTLLHRAPTISGFITTISTGKTTRSELVNFARSLEGTRYKYGSVDPNKGLDCSGFVTCVFNHFGIAVPRRSVDFTAMGNEIDLKDAQPGDLILFTGTNYHERTVGHMGIILSRPGSDIRFVHSTSGKAYEVTETNLNDYYITRYVETIRVFPTPIPYRY